MESRGHRRAKKPQSGFFSRHYYSKFLSQAQQENTGQPFLR